MREMGGYLPLELRDTGEYFRGIPDEWIGRYDCGRTALYAAIQALGAKKVWIPYFYCPSVWKFLSDLGIELKAYHINEELLPGDIPENTDDVVLIINYYGILDGKVKEYVQTHRNIIIDNALSFYSTPIIRQDIMNMYSCRKFFGVSDGAYLIGMSEQKLELKSGESNQRASFLLKSIECGTNAAYADSLKNEELFGSGFYSMSKLTYRILKSIDYEGVKQKRINNFHYLHKRMKKWQKLNVLEEDYPAYCYPLLLDEDIRSKLIEQKMYIPTLWKELICDKFEGTLEYKFSKNLLCLPMDQRYGIEEMEYMCSVIEHELTGRRK